MPSDEKQDLLNSAAVVGVCLLFGLVLGGWVLGAKIASIKLADRTVTVKGLVERTVKSDRAIWAITFKTAGDDLPTVFAHSEAHKSAVMKFLSDQGISAAEVTTGQISVTDKQTNQYVQNGGSRYILQQTVTVSTGDVDKLAAAGAKTALLIQAGVVLADDSKIAYKFTGLNALKPDMITEATRNARASADRFAADSGSEVGVIRSANQGVFSISADGATADAASDDAPGGGGEDAQADASIMKKVRVVATIEYYLK